MRIQHEEYLFCKTCNKELTDKKEDDLIETGAPISGSCLVCPYCKTDNHEYRKRNPVKIYTEYEIKEAIIEVCGETGDGDFYIPIIEKIFERLGIEDDNR